MTDHKRQCVADIMDNNSVSVSDVEELINDSEMQTIWSRFHLVRDLMQGDVPEAIDPQMSTRISAAIQSEPALLVPQARQTVSVLRANFNNWTKQASGFAIAASVTAMMIYGVQLLNKPVSSLSPSLNNSAITSLELLNTDTPLIDHEIEYTQLQENLLEYTRTESLYGLQYKTPLVSVVNYTVPVKLRATSENVYYNLEKKSAK